MPAGLFERSTGLGDAWEAADVWLEPHGGADELRAGVARRRGAAVPRPVCGAPHLHPRDGGPGRRAARKASLMSERPLAARARAMAEAPRAARPMPDGGPAARGLDRWPGWVAHSNVPRMKRVAATVREERGGILSWFSRRSTNGIVEGMNPAIQSMKRAARGFRGLADFTAPIFLGLGRLEFAATSATGCAAH